MAFPDSDEITADEDANRVLRLIREGDIEGLEQHARDRAQADSRRWEMEGKVGS